MQLGKPSRRGRDGQRKKSVTQIECDVLTCLKGKLRYVEDQMTNPVTARIDQLCLVILHLPVCTDL
jgi:hypothetical protein